MYDASATARKFTVCEMIDWEVGNDELSEIEEEIGKKEIRSDLEHMPGFRDFSKKGRSIANKANLSKEIRRSAHRKRILR